MCSWESVNPSFEVSIGPSTVWTDVRRGVAESVARCAAFKASVAGVYTVAMPNPATARAIASRLLM